MQPVYDVDLGLAVTLLLYSFLVSNFIVTKMYIYRCKGKAFFLNKNVFAPLFLVKCLKF